MYLISSHVRSVLVKFKAPARALSSHNLLQEARDNHIDYDSHRVVRLFPFFFLLRRYQFHSILIGRSLRRDTKCYKSI